MNYPRAWAHLLTRGYVATDGRPMITVSYPELFRQIGYSYGGQGNVFLLPKVVDRMDNPRYAIHTIRGDILDVAIVDAQLEHGAHNTLADAMNGLSQARAGIDPYKVLEDCQRALDNAKESLLRAQNALDEGRAILKGLRHDDSPE